MESIEGKIDQLKEAPVQGHTVYRIEQALMEGHEWICVPADMLRTVEVVALHELGYKMANLIHIGEIQIWVRGDNPEEFEF